MLTLWGKLYQNGRTICADTFTSQKPEISDAILECMDRFPYDKFEIQIIDSADS